jgi:hypothetical protein
MTAVIEASYAQKREALLSYYKKGIKPADGRQPIPEYLAQQMVQELNDRGISKDATIGVVDTFLTLTLTLIEHGYTNIVYLENTHSDLTDSQKKYYDVMKNGCVKLGVTYYVPPMNNWTRCNMNFTAILGNPPYQGNSDSKRWVLWHQFLQTAVENSEYVSYVIPASITSPGKMWNLIRNNLVKIDLTVGSHFPGVGSTFCRIVWDPKYTGNTEVIADDGVFSLDLSSYDFLPKVVNEHNLSLYKFFTNNRKWQRTTEYHTTHKSKWAGEEGVEVWHTTAQSFKTTVHHPNNDKIRVGISLSGYPKFRVMQNMGGTATIVWTECDTVEEAQDLADYLNGPDIQEIMNVFKWSGWNKLEVIKLLG